MKRKEFIKNSSLLAAAALLTNSKVFGFQENIVRVGLIGTKGMGWSNLNAILKVPGVVCTALCDVDENVLKNRAMELKKRDINVKTYINYQDLLSASDVDVVIVATPDH